ncbi:MAG: hypothetical protein ABSE04_01715 [Candidatus Microgenomates bacterium]|jgi:hypothetical protein
MIYYVIFGLIVFLFYGLYAQRKEMLRRFGEDSTTHFSLHPGRGDERIFDRPILRKFIGIDKKYSDKKFGDLPKEEIQRIGRFARGEKEFRGAQGTEIDFCPGFLFFYDKDLVFTSVQGKGSFSPIPYGKEDSLYYTFFHSEDYKKEIAFIIRKRFIENVIPGRKILVYTGYLKDEEIDHDHKKKNSEKIDILFDFPVALTLPTPHWQDKNYEKELEARKELAKKFGLEFKEGDLNIEGFEGDLGEWENPSTSGHYEGKYFEFDV